jgi:histidine triad (HIT) family protein
MTEPRSCAFCERVRMRQWIHTMSNMAVFEPLNPVVEGHLLVIPFAHIETALISPAVTASLFGYAASMARLRGIQQANLITNAGKDATQSIMHVQVHIIPRKKGDRLLLPWSPQSGRKPRVGSAEEVLAETTD